MCELCDGLSDPVSDYLDGSQAPPEPPLEKLIQVDGSDGPVFMTQREYDREHVIQPDEIRSVSDTGGEKGVKTADYAAIPTLPLKLLAEHYGKGAKKYSRDDKGRDNYRKGYEWSKSYAALQRHLNQFWDGEDIDEETGSLHLVAAAWHCFTLVQFLSLEEYGRFDDRQDA